LVVAPRTDDWHKLKMLVLDSVSSPITRRVYNMTLEEFFTVSAWWVSLEVRGLGSSSIIIRMSAIRKPAVEATDNGLLAPELAAGITRVKSVKSQGIGVGNWLSLRQAQGLLGTPDITTTKGAARSWNARGDAGLWLTAVRSGSTYVQAHTTARWPLVHRRLSRQARPRPYCAHADLGEGRHRRLDRRRRSVGRSGIPIRQPSRPRTRRSYDREGSVADAPAICRGIWRARYCAP
jgi:hypothetical protein